jgi:filamentous hemagglutinin family protein
MTNMTNEMSIAHPFRFAPVVCALAACGLIAASPIHAAPQGGQVVAGSASIATQGATTTIVQTSDRAIVNWRDFSLSPGEAVRFVQPGSRSAILNRGTGERAWTLDGAISANGQVFLINPHGIVIGKDARIDVGSLVASTSAIGDEDFLAGRLNFRPSGVAGAGIRNAGSITAAEGGLVALVAPHVRNDGVIEARMGRVQIGAADRFTIDLYGDGLINLSLDPSNRGALHDAEGRPVDELISMHGAIHTPGGSTVLIAAADAGAVLDRAINLQGVVRAEGIAESGGRIVLSGGSGAVELGGQLVASGTQGGQIDVTGATVHLPAGALVDAHGSEAGGSVRIGGDWQGQGDLPRSQRTGIDAGARIDVRAEGSGDAGRAVVWSDGHTAFAGTIDARGGEQGGNGGQVEVSGKGTLSFSGLVEAGAAQGRGGSLLLDPATMDIGATEAALIARVLRTGATATVLADVDINVNALVDGRGRAAGGGLTLTAGRDINVNEFIVTNNGALRMTASTGTVNFAAGKAAYTGSGAISVATGGNLALGNLFTTGALTARSTGGTLTVAQGIDGLTGAVSLRAANDLTVAQPIVNLLNGSSLELTSDTGNINVNAQIDGRAANGVPSGTVTLTAGNGIVLNESIVTEDNSLALSAVAGTVTAAAGKGLFAGGGGISVTTGGALSSGIYGTTGALALRSTGGAVTVATKLDETLGNVTLRGATDVNINQGIANLRNGSPLTVVADTGNINVNARIDAQDDTNPSSTVTPVPGGTVTLTAGNNININDTIVTFNGAVNATATAGTVAFSNAGTNGSGNKKILAGSAPITITTGGNFTTGTTPPAGLVFSMGSLAGPPDNDAVNAFLAEALKPWVTMGTTGKLTITSTGGNVSIDAPIPQTTGEIAISAGNNVVVNEKLINVGTAGNPITITAGTACTVGTCAPASQGKIIVNNSNSDTSITVNYTNGGVQTVPVFSSPEVDARQANLVMSAFGDVNINENVASAANISITSSNGTLFGAIGSSRFGGGSRPQNLTLSGGAGIGALGSPFSAGTITNSVTATSANGAVYLFVDGTGTLGVTAPSPTAGDVFMYSGASGLGSTVSLTAGRDVDITNSGRGGALTMNAGRDVRVQSMIANSITVTGAGQDVLFDYTGDPQYASLYLRGALTVSGVGRDIRFLNSAGVSLMDADGNPTNGTQPALSLSAGRDVEVRRVQTYGAVSIAAGDDITLFNDLGPVITSPVDFTINKGVGSVTLTTPQLTLFGVPLNVTSVQGIRSVGPVNITTGTLTATRAITSTGSTVAITTITPFSNPIAAIGSMAEMLEQPIIAPAIPPGPVVNAPAPPAALNALAPASPGGVAVGSSTAPGGTAGEGLVVIDPEKAVPAEFGEIVPDGEGQGAGKIAENEIEVPLDSPSQTADFGRSGPYSGRAPTAARPRCEDQPGGRCA